MQIADLPDYAALQQIARALWKEGKTRGAAVLVGAGFSRNAQLLHDGGNNPPLWNDLANEMQRRLDPSGTPWKDPLRLAEEFRVVLGEPALEGLIRDLVTDEEWLPSELHKRLVQLPWVDILTTNWDTLLERAADSVIGQSYETVRSLEDVATTRAPRIVKLHGSLPSNRPFILSEEDYRTYPRLFAPFVNLVQQVLLENELCLIGFSGDDPNFLTWTGWIRDQLGVSARKIYLVGTLNLRPAQRRLLELRNISIVDFQPLLMSCPQKDRHRLAAESFLKFLETSRPQAPWTWPDKQDFQPKDFQPDPKDQAKHLTTLIPLWSKQRKAYPGWAVCPEGVVLHLKHSTISPEFNKNALQEMTLPERCRLFFELAWRLDTAQLSIPDWLQQEVDRLADKSDGWDDQSHRHFVQLFLLKRARESNMGLAEDLLQKLRGNVDLEADLKAAVAYQGCLKAKGELDFDSVERGIRELQGEDPLWRLRKGALLCWLGNFSEAQAAVDQAITELRWKYARNRHSLWVLSRLAWAHFAKKQYRHARDEEPAPDLMVHDDLDSLQSRISEAKCDPWDIFQSIERRAESEIQKFEERRQTIETRFDAGTYRDHSGDLYFGGWDESALRDWGRLADQVGLPERVKNLDSLVSRMERAEWAVEPKSIEDFQRVLNLVQEGAQKILERRFSRLETARLPDDVYAWLLQTTLRSLDNALPRIEGEKGLWGSSWTARATSYIELLSRLIVRADSEKALVAWRKGLQIARLSKCPSTLFEPLGHLMQRSISAVPPQERSALILDALEFPLPDERGLPEHIGRDWPVAANWFSTKQLKRAETDGAFSSRIQVLLDKVRSSTVETRGMAAVWLVHLHEAEVLSPSESSAFGEALWSRRDSDDSFPSATNLRPFVYLSIPGHPREDILRLLTRNNSHINHAEYFLAIAEVTRKKRTDRVDRLYTSDEALKRLEEVLKWLPSEAPGKGFNNVSSENREVSEALGDYVANSVIPALSAGDLRPEMIRELIQKQEAVPSLVLAFPELLRLAPECTSDVSMAILKTMTSRDSRVSGFGFSTIYRWTQLIKEQALSEFPEMLTDGVTSTIEMRREPGLLHALNIARFLLEAGLLSKTNQDRMTSVLGMVNIETAYRSSFAVYSEERTISLIRAAATKLAGELKKAGIDNVDIENWIASAETDPMPEVRFALSSSED